MPQNGDTPPPISTQRLLGSKHHKKVPTLETSLSIEKTGGGEEGEDASISTATDKSSLVEMRPSALVVETRHGGDRLTPVLVEESGHFQLGPETAGPQHTFSLSVCIVYARLVSWSISYLVN